jgi:hypothetical protein
VVPAHGHRLVIMRARPLAGTPLWVARSVFMNGFDSTVAA